MKVENFMVVNTGRMWDVSESVKGRGREDERTLGRASGLYKERAMDESWRSIRGTMTLSASKTGHGYDRD